MNTAMSLAGLSAWLADAALQATLLLTVVGSILWLRPGMAAARRHSLTAAALLTIPLLMLCSGLVPMWQPFAGQSPTVTVALPKSSVLETQRPNKVMSAPSMASPAAKITRTLERSNVMITLWLAGIGIGLLTLLKAALELRRLRLESKVEQDERICHHFKDVQRVLRIELPDHALRRSVACSVPMTWGWDQRTILLPSEASAWSDARLQLVLRHELAHIARGDVLASLLTTVSALLLWFHPLVWMLWRACNSAREEACDDIALQHSASSREDFADELLATVTSLRSGTQRSFLPLALAMASSSQQALALRKRIAGILDSSRARAPWSVPQRAAILFCVAGTAAALAGLTACRALPQSNAQIVITSKVFEFTSHGDNSALADAGLSLGTDSGLKLIGTHDEKSITTLLTKLKAIKGLEMMTAPSVTARNRHSATIEVVREFTYPSEWAPPTLPGFTGGQPIQLPIQLKPGQTIAVTPTTPTAFEMRKVGVQMRFVPEIASDGRIDLQFEPEITQFEGFKNYGSPIRAVTAGADGKMREATLSENKISQPIFSTVKNSTHMTLPNDATVIFGGLVRTDVNDETNQKTDRLVFLMVRAKIQ